MDKIIASLIAAAVIAGAFLFSRTASASQSIEPEEPDFVPPSGIRGLINNNPFNIKFRTSIQWRGQTGTDGTFVVFNTALNGLRAGMINIHTKFTRDGANTVRALMNILSPSSENPTENFIAFVSGKLSVSPEQPLQFLQIIIPLSQAIVTFETGVPNGGFPDSLYRQALQESGRA